MNELSWLIYAADVAGSLKTVSTVGVVLGVASIATSIVVWQSNSDAQYIWSTDDKDKVLCSRATNRDAAIKAGRISAVVAIVSLVFTIISPSSNTIYAIAASEMGEEIITSPTATKAVKALDAWLDRQIAPEAGQ